MAMIRSYGMSHVGRVRTNNEDSYIARAELNLFAVADGMGGAQAGERASQITIQTVVEEVERSGAFANIEDLAEAVREANRRVRVQARESPELAGMGTTVVAALVHLDRIQIVNVGDSRAYLQSDGALYCITTDHSWVNEVGRSLGLSDEQLRTHPYRNVLTKAVGAEEQIEVQKLEIEFRAGDLLLLCSDGLHGVAGDRTIQEVLRHGGPLRDRCEALIEATLEKGAPDNITAVLVERTGNGD